MIERRAFQDHPRDDREWRQAKHHFSFANDQEALPIRTDARVLIDARDGVAINDVPAIPITAIHDCELVLADVR